MTESPDGTCSHFSICNPRGKTQSNLPRLLRRLATEVAALGEAAMVLDVTVAYEIDENGPWWESTVYYVRDGWSEDDSGSASALVITAQ